MGAKELYKHRHRLESDGRSPITSSFEALSKETAATPAARSYAVACEKCACATESHTTVRRDTSSAAASLRLVAAKPPRISLLSQVGNTF
jgi:hypothetical protein